MARARNIKPGLFKNEHLGMIEPIISLLFIGLWTLADKSGRMEDRPLRIKAELFPYRDNLDINGYLTQLQRLGFIHRYKVGDLELIEVANFEKHQNPHHTEKASEYPAYSIDYKITVKSPLDNGYTPADSLIPDSLIPDIKPLSEKKHSDDFNQFWKAYPKKTGKGAALKAWNKAKPPIDKVLQALAWQRTSKQWTDGFIPLPATYINQTRWEDEPDTKLGGGAAQVIYQSQPVQRDVTKIAEKMKMLKAAL